MKSVIWLAEIFLVVMCLGHITLRCTAEKQSTQTRRVRALYGSLGTFSGEPRGKNSRTDIPAWYKARKSGKGETPERVNVEQLVSELVEIKANTFHWMIWFAPTDWEDLQRFLPLAAEKGIAVWVTVMPPKQQLPKGFTRPIYSEPYRLDYDKWAEEIAKLSLQETNLVAWSIDDFSWDLKTFTPERLRHIVNGARAINPQLAFVPCLYYPTLVKTDFIERYGSLIDGVLFPYRHDSEEANLSDSGLVKSQVKQIRKVLGPSIPIIIDVYATAHSTLGSSTPEYVKQVMLAARDCADGVHVYCHQCPKAFPEKHKVVKELFYRWSAEDAPTCRERAEGNLSNSKKLERDEVQ